MENRVVTLSIKLAEECLELKESLKSNRKFSIANQLIRSGTSVGANIAEAQGSMSNKEFYHKLSLAYKEALETRYWLQLCNTNIVKVPNAKNTVMQIIKILSKSLSTLRKKKTTN